MAGNAQETAATIGVTQANTIVGTAALCPQNKPLVRTCDARSDIFSFGAVFYEMLSGRQAFRGESIVETISSVLRDEPPPFDAPPAVSTVLKRCLCKSASGRFATIRDVSDAIRHVGERSADAAPSIAVLPFANLSADPEHEYFTDGIADDILNALVQHPRHCTSSPARRRSRSRSKHSDLRKIAHTLGVANVLEGSVRRVRQPHPHHRAARSPPPMVSISSRNATTDSWPTSSRCRMRSPQRLRMPCDSRWRRGKTGRLAIRRTFLPTKHCSRHAISIGRFGASRWPAHASSTSAPSPSTRTMRWRTRCTPTICSGAQRSECRHCAKWRRSFVLRLIRALDSILIYAMRTHRWCSWRPRTITTGMKQPVALVATSGGAISPLSRMGLGWAFCLSSGRLHEAVEQLDLAVQGDPLHLTHRAMLAMGLGAVDRFAEAEELLSSGVVAESWLLLDLFRPRRTLRGTRHDDEHFHQRSRRLLSHPGMRQVSAFMLGRWSAPVIERVGVRSHGHWVPPRATAYRSAGPCSARAVNSTPPRSGSRAIEERYSMVGAFLQSAIGQPLRRSAHWPSLARLRNLPT